MKKQEGTGIKDSDKEKIIALISALLPKAKIILFGSRAAGSWRTGSDLDIAIDTGRRIKISDLGEIKSVLEGTNIPHSIDVVDYNFVDELMKKMIDQEGIKWKN